MSVSELASLLDKQYTVPSIKEFIGNSTRVRIDYVLILSIDDDTHALVEFDDGVTMSMTYGLPVPSVGQTWRARRISGVYQLDDLRRP